MSRSGGSEQWGVFGNAPMKMYSYLVEGLPEGQWRWTIFSDDHRPVKSDTSQREHDARMAALKAIDELKKQDEERR